jgi:hypothetical protein
MRDEEPLQGGNSTNVIRIGDTVRRDVSSVTPTIHALLRHLDASGFAGAPRVLGIDEQGREILTFLPGEIGFLPFLWNDAAVDAAARLLRALHDATVAWTPPPDATWRFIDPDPACREVICHNDFAPYNLVCADRQPYALIDYDEAGPGSRLRDVAFGAYWFAPLSWSSDLASKSDHDMQQDHHRLRLFCASYGVPVSAALFDMVDQRLREMGDAIEHGAAVGDLRALRLKAGGHLDHWRRELIAFRGRRSRL